MASLHLVVDDLMVHAPGCAEPREAQASVKCCERQTAQGPTTWTSWNGRCPAGEDPEAVGIAGGRSSAVGIEQPGGLAVERDLLLERHQVAAVLAVGRLHGLGRAGR